MSLATRCPACGTVFRVVQDQLKVSQGWVRCGQCQEVFNALEGLFELPPAPAPLPATPTPSASATGSFSASPAMLPPAPANGPPASAPAAAEAPATAAAMAQGHDALQASAADSDFAPTAPAELDLPLDLLPPSAAKTPERPGPEATRATTPASTDAAPLSVMPGPAPAAAGAATALDSSPPAVADAPMSRWGQEALREARQHPQVDTSLLDEDGRQLDTDALAAPFDMAEAIDSMFAPGRRRDPNVQRPPEFVRQAERAARWRHPATRLVLGSASALLAALLLAQLAVFQRDLVAARWPALQPALTSACEALRCQVASPYALEQITLDSSHLSATDTPGLLRLDADLHNRANHPVRAPALELSITSDSGSTLVRKVLRPAELGHAESLEADGTWHVDLRFDVGDLHVAGYTVEVFYP